MRLSKIKLAGFKSFVDPTTVSLPTNIVGIVGPNGCGKSNIIDAVRWVMGESSAKHLRGESMVDVIFNGSYSRTPVSKASIELVFDNPDAALGGKYASYTEISVCRQVNRDGQSTYYLNGTRCRRRDITDVFLGTGLGPRSYSIIEQGMIARIIEARPEELRAHLEEAAGISLYRERRKETERRMHDTRENLERLDDIRNELGRQLDRLRRQAQAAKRYQTLKSELRHRQAQLYVLKLRSLDAEQQRVLRELDSYEVELEAQLAQQRALESKLQNHRDQGAECGDLVNEIQARFYAVGSEIARLEQQIQHRRELRETSHRERERNRETLGEIERSYDQDGNKLAQLRLRLEELGPALEEVVQAETAGWETVESLQRLLEEWRQGWDRFSEEAAQPERIVQVERARIEQLEQRIRELEQRRQRQLEESEHLLQDDSETELEQLADRERQLSEEIEQLQDGHRQAHIGALREQLIQQNDGLNEFRERLQQDRARLTSLETIQQAALGENESLRAWFEGQELDGERRLAQWLEVEPGWEHAVEMVLGAALQAVVTERVHVLHDTLLQPRTGTLMLFSPTASILPGHTLRAGAQALREKVSAPWAMDDLLGHVYCVEDMEAARTLLACLDWHESVITPEGIWMGQRWTRMRGTDASEAGIIERQREIQQLRAGNAVCQERLTALESKLEETQTELADAEAGFEVLREELAERRQTLAGVRAQSESRSHRRQEILRRRSQLEREQAEIALARQNADQAIQAAQEHLQQARLRGEELDCMRVQHEAERQQLQSQLTTAREQLHELQARRHELALQQRSADTARSALEESVGRLGERRRRLLLRDAELEAALAEQDVPESELGEELGRRIGERQAVEAELVQARNQQVMIEQALRELEPERMQMNQQMLELRQALEAVRLREQELKIRRQSQAELLLELGYEPEALAAELDPEQTEAACAQELSRIEDQIKRLGLINLAAIEECQALEERKGYLEGQHADLTTALETLEQAIRRIDLETRRRFKETYEKVNHRLGQLFPLLFGGGQAHLELTGGDLLGTAITIMARPPGKKITSIHLLSSGEKALTAVSLVFALFELNPAPFCLLDEVDAPLDEANVGRFCDLLREQSRRVQFIMITHNKTTMQAASHLIGVTMHEPGVSRLVTVDLARAVELAAV